MPFKKKQLLGLLNTVDPKDIESLCHKTVLAILVIAISYVLGVLLFALLCFLKIEYCFMALTLPLLAYLWIMTIGAKHVNNYYGFKKTPEGTMIYIKNRNGYSTFIGIHIFVFFISSIIRLIYEINNLRLIKQEIKIIMRGAEAKDQSILIEPKSEVL